MVNWNNGIMACGSDSRPEGRCYGSEKNCGIMGLNKNEIQSTYSALIFIS